MPLVIGTRGSRLALAQTTQVADLLKSQGIEVITKIINTEGDKNSGVPLHEIGGQGVFVRALDVAILEGEVDCAVHSMKDIPAIRPGGLFLAAVLKRDSPCDYLAYETERDKVDSIGTSSTRRTAQIRKNFPGIEVKQLRGNVDTRIRKLKGGEYSAIILAKAGLERLSIDIPGETLNPDIFVPSPNQGIISIVAREDEELCKLFEKIDHHQTRQDAEIERKIMERIGGGCFTPIGIYSNCGYVICEVLSLNGDRSIRRESKISNISVAEKFGLKMKEEAAELISEAKISLRLEE